MASSSTLRTCLALPPLAREEGSVCVEGSVLSAADSRSLCLPQGEGEVEMGEVTQEDESGLLTIHDVTRAHAGLYQCMADNGIAPAATVGVELVVQCEFVVFSLQNTHKDVLVGSRKCQLRLVSAWLNIPCSSCLA